VISVRPTVLELTNAAACAFDSPDAPCTAGTIPEWPPVGAPYVDQHGHEYRAWSPKGNSTMNAAELQQTLNAHAQWLDT